jgi:hypothetical protein
MRGDVPARASSERICRNCGDPDSLFHACPRLRSREAAETLETAVAFTPHPERPAEEIWDDLSVRFPLSAARIRQLLNP